MTQQTLTADEIALNDIEARALAEEWATMLANGIADHFGKEPGISWREAMELLCFNPKFTTLQAQLKAAQEAREVMEMRAGALELRAKVLARSVPGGVEAGSSLPAANDAAKPERGSCANCGHHDPMHTKGKVFCTVNPEHYTIVEATHCCEKFAPQGGEK